MCAAAIAEFSEGDRILVQFTDDEVPDLWQERVLTGLIVGSWFIAAMPGKEFEDVDLLGDNIGAVWLLAADRKLPWGISAEDCYMVYVEGRRPSCDWSANEIRGFTLEDKRLAEVTKAHEGIGAAVGVAEERPAARLRAKVSPAQAAAGGVRVVLPTAPARDAVAARPARQMTVQRCVAAARWAPP